MALYYNSAIRALNPLPNDVTTVFNTPSKFVAGTVRVVQNGQVYEPDDTRKGWAEITDQTVQMVEAPRAGDILQAFYMDADSEHIGLDNVVGSPFDPNGVIP